MTTSHSPHDGDAEPIAVSGDICPGEAVLGALLDATHLLAPDHIPAVVDAAIGPLGASEAVVYLADLEQRRLVPFRAGERSPLDIDGTLAGRVFRSSEPAISEDPAGTSRSRIWLPLLDGSDRLGVLGITVGDIDPLTVQRCRQLASLVAEVLVAKTEYGDAITTARRTKPLSLPAEMRWSLIPPQTFTGANVGLSAVLEPAYDIAGDAFDYAVNGNELHVAIFDAMGHGLRASRLANLAVFSYRNSRRLGLDLEETYRRMDEIVEAEFAGDFVTAQLGVLDVATGHFRWVNAGHPHPVLVRGRSTAIALRSETCLPIGLGDREAEIGELSLEPDDRLLFFSDGVTEARRAGGLEFGRPRLEEFLVRAIAAGEQPPETVRRLIHAVLAFQDGRIDDDATVMLVHWQGRG